jgi:hypothetical protein
VPSSVIRHYDYDEEARSLEITFVTGRVYVYSDVPADVAANFAAARSRGEFFNKHIRDAFRYVEVTPTLS